MTTRHECMFVESIRIRLDVGVNLPQSSLLLAHCVCEAPVSDAVPLPGVAAVIVSGVLGRDGAGTGGYLVGLGNDSRLDSAALRLLWAAVSIGVVPTTKDRLS